MSHQVAVRTRLAAGRLTVVIVAYRSRDVLSSCLDSLAADPDLAEVQVVVVDNDSGDGTLEMLAERHPRVRAVDAGGNVGFSRANNLVLGDVDTDLVLLLNPDTVVAAGAIAACVAALDAAPEVGVLGCKLVTADGTLDHACKRSFPDPLGAAAYFLHVDGLVARVTGKPGYRSHHVGDDDVADVDAVNGAFMLVRVAAMRQVGLLDERFWMYGEDLDWCLRFQQRGWKVRYWPQATVVHLKGGTEGGRRGERTTRAFHEAMWLFYEKHHAPSHGRLANAAVRAAIAVRGRVALVRARRAATGGPA